MSVESWIDEELKELESKHLLRRATAYPAAGGRVTIDGRAYLNFASNDYLGLAGHPDVVAASRRALEQYGAGATASRLVAGTLPIHEELEQRLAAHKGYPAALLFGSGFLTNMGMVPALVGRSDHVFADRLAHASLMDAVTLSRASLHRFRHNDADHLGELLAKAPASGRKLVMTESIFSMDGDAAPLPDIAERAEKYGAMLLVDEAHATGVFGPAGAGLTAEHNLAARTTLAMGTLSKGLGSYGGFVACSNSMRRWLIAQARAFIYTTALPPAIAGASLGALDVLERQPDLGRDLLRRAEAFRKNLQAAGLNTLKSSSQIVPVLVGDNERTLTLATRLREKGLIVAAIRPPTVPPGTARLRLSVTLAHAEAELAAAAELIANTAREAGAL
ncbi:MAG TPA: 8-amino-7-oxononanoate synthase [Verrucomicrobia bacterium]|nr:MAG: 8-amino-7-oxononanoate synthase [Lentisphaerae bacterium GWF2_57_35]HBA83610.1 8-amino-7-oxononanoate synthase [Verrucomicrobiota bacterium]